MGNPYPHKYQFGKQEEIMEPKRFHELMQIAEAMGETMNHLAFLTGLWYAPVRKSELYERRLDPHMHGDREVQGDVTITKNFVTIDFGVDYGYYQGCRKKHGAKVPPLDLPRAFYGVNEYLVPWIEKRLASESPQRLTRKAIKYQEDTGETTERTYRLRSGGTVTRTVPLLKWRRERIRAMWLFPHIGNVTSWQIVKRVFGEKYYPHYLRLRKLSAVGGNPETATMLHLKSVSGIKSLHALEAYLGVSKKAQSEAMQVE